MIFTNTTYYLKRVGLIFLIAWMAPLASAAVLFEDDFSSSSVIVANRLRVGNIGDGFVRFSSSNFRVTNGELINPINEAGVGSEGAVLQVLDLRSIDAALMAQTSLTFSFDYNVGEGSTLFFHALGLSGGTTFDVSTQLHNTGASNGAIQSQFNDFPIANRGDFTGTNLGGGAANGTRGTALVSLAGGTSGTFTQTIDFGTLTGIDSLADLQLLTFGFAIDTTSSDGTQPVSIDNFSLTTPSPPIPEPRSIVTILLSSMIILLYRKRQK